MPSRKSKAAGKPASASGGGAGPWSCNECGLRHAGATVSRKDCDRCGAERFPSGPVELREGAPPPTARAPQSQEARRRAAADAALRRAGAAPAPPGRPGEPARTEEAGAEPSGPLAAATGGEAGSGAGAEAKAGAEAEAFLLREFVSGGQTGADSIPFTVAGRLGVGLRGYMPRDFKRDDGRGREIAERYGLLEGEGGYKWRDMANAELSDACMAFLTTLPMTGKGTMQTVSVFTRGEYSFHQIDKPSDADFLVQEPAGPGLKPAIVFWDIAADRLEAFAEALHAFLNRHRPKALMVSGSVEQTWPGVEALGAELLLKTWQQAQSEPEAECGEASAEG